MFQITLCPHCQAQNSPAATRCWLCDGALNDEAVLAEVVGPADSRSGTLYTVTALLVIVALVAVGVGLWGEAPGVAMLLFVVAAPAVLATLVRIHVRRRRGEAISPGQTALDYLLSAAVIVALTFGAGALVIAGVVVYLFLICSRGFVP